jgi:2'-5' RNA ligase
VRLFAAVEIGDMLRNRAAEISQELQRRAFVAAPRAKVAWVPADRMHVTIRFIGEVDGETASSVRRVLGVPIAIEPFALTLWGVGTFPKTGTPRVVWVGITEGREELLAIERELTERLTTLGVPEEDRAFSPHLTLARVREPAGLKVQRLVEGLTDQPMGTVRIDAITLFQSKLSPKGPAYTPLLHIPLSSTPSSQ